jgi:hypothetical protein
MDCFSKEAKLSLKCEKIYRQFATFRPALHLFDKIKQQKN